MMCRCTYLVIISHQYKVVMWKQCAGCAVYADRDYFDHLTQRTAFKYGYMQLTSNYDVPQVLMNDTIYKSWHHYQRNTDTWFSVYGLAKT